MKQKLMKRLLLAVLTLGMPLMAWADRDVSQLQFGKQTITVASDEVITFYDPWGTENIVDNNSYNSQSLTVFKPAEEGMSVQITFEKLDLDQYGTSYYLYLNIYDGIADADDSFNFATATSDITGSSSLAEMKGTLIAEKINNDNRGASTYCSSTSNGALSVGFMHRNSNECEGWVAKVKCVKLENQVVTGAGSSYENVVANPTTKVNVPLAVAYVTAEGVMSPDNITAITFRLTQNEGMIDPLSVKLFGGKAASMKDATPVDASVTANGDLYTLTLNAEPSEGTTYFTLAADILGTAAIGAAVQLDIVSIVTNAFAEGITPFTAAESIAVLNPSLVLMNEATAQTITVGETALNFYDEGGADGKIIGTNKGQVTFLSAVEGQKVMVDFSKIEINNGSNYYQALNIYNGTEATAENLITTLRSGNTGIVHSTAADGALTIVLTPAQQTYEYDGWEAIVSIFTPQPMEIDEFVVNQVSEGTVAAGDKGQQILSFNLKTKNTEPAMTASAFTFSTNDTFSRLSHATLYFTGADNTFSDGESNKFGEADITANAFTITAAEALTLSEGDNYFWLCYDLNDEALNDETVDAALTAATLNGEAVTVENGNPEGSRSVRNIVYSYADMGHQTRTVNGSVAFETKTAGTYSTYCEAGTDDRIVTFVPKHEGMVAQIDFSLFNVQYSSSSYGNKSKFVIYNGSNTSADILWQLNSSDQQETGPGTTIRSTAADGSLTILFNPNSSYSYYYKGFQATVSEYLSRDMQATSVSATQASTADASIGAADQDLLNICITTEGNLNPLTLNSLKLNLKDSEANLSAVSLWQGETRLASVEAAAEVDIVLTEAVALAEGDNLFTVKADVSESAEENAVIDARLISVVLGSETVEATEGDPDGSRTLKNQVLMTAGDHGTLNLGLGKTVGIFDDGGAEADGADGVEATLTLAPSGDADCIRLTNQGISFAYTAHLYIYKGSEVNDDNLIIDLSGSSAKFDPIITDADFDGGQLTIKYVGKGSYTRPNFAIQAEGYKKTDVAITSVTAEDISVGKVLKGQNDIRMLRIAVEAHGELTPAVITSFNIEGTDAEVLDAFHIYQTGTLTTFSANDAFTGEYAITKSGTYYFWLTYDVTAEAAVGQTATATLNSITANDATIAASAPAATASITVATGKHGIYTVGIGDCDYATIQSAIDGMGSLGIDGPVTLKIKAGEYVEKVRIPYIKGMGSVNTLTLESESGQRDVKIYHNQYTTGGYSDDQHKKDYGVVTLYEASYVTLRNLEITTTDVAYKAVVMVKDESRHVTIDNCYLHAPTTTTGDVTLVNHTIIDEENRNNDYLTVRGCLLEGGKIGVSMGGTSYVKLPKEVGGIIEGNTFRNNGTKSIYIMDELGVKVRNNTITIDADAATKISVGILDMQLRDEYAEATEITGNIFNVAPVSYAAVINLRQLEGTADAPVLIANNVINLTSLNASYSAFKFNGDKIKHVNVANNTIRMTGEQGGAAFWASSKLSEGYGNVLVVNNIIQNESNGYAVNLYHDDNLAEGLFTFQNNTFYTAGETFFRASASTTGDFDAFVEKTGATDCINEKVNFLSDLILEPADDLEGQLLTAKPLSYVSVDVNGTERNAETPTIGAYEYSDENEPPVLAEGYPAVASVSSDAALINVKVNANGTAYATLLTPADEVPTAEQLLLSDNRTLLSRDTEAAIRFAELQPATDYVVYLIVQNTRGVTTEVQTIPFTTAVVIPDVAIEAEGEDIDEGENAQLLVSVLSGTAPFTIEWRNGLHEVIGTTTLESMDEVSTFEYAPTYPDDYYVTVTDANMRTATDTARIVVRTAEPLVATFENLYLDAESHWAGPDTKGSVHAGTWGGQELWGSFLSGSFMFDNHYNLTYNSWEGFAYTNRTATTFRSYTTDQYNSCVGHGVDESPNFGVAYGNTNITLVNSAEGAVVPGFYVTNSANNVNAYLNGDGMTDAFTTGDSFTLVVTGYNGTETTGAVRVLLADYTSEDEAEHTYISDWQYVDLTSLGTVTRLAFSYEGGHSNSYGMTTPNYVCIDNFGAAPVVPELAFACEGDDVTLGDEATLTLYPADGVAPFQYEWQNGRHEVIAQGTIESLDELMATVSYTPAECDDYYVTVTDAAGQTRTDTCRVVVRSAEPVVATFENLYLDDESHWTGPDTKGDIVTGAWGDKQQAGSFVSGSYQFDNNYSLDWGSWSGSAYSNHTATTFSSYNTDQWNSCVGHGTDESANYGVAYDATTIRVLSSADGAVVPGFYVTNSANNVNAYLNGDGMTDAFTTGDSFTLVVTGYNGTETTGAVRVLLADYTSEDEAEHTYISDWQYVDLTSLGTVTHVTFSYEGGHSSAYGLATPAYVCIDNFGAEAPVVDAIASLHTSFAAGDIEAYYTLDGRRLSTAQKGINVVRMKDGTTRRIYIK